MCNRPVIFACRSFNNPVQEANAGISIEPGDPSQLADALVQLSKMDEKDLLSMGHNGHNWVIKNHSLKILHRS